MTEVQRKLEQVRERLKALHAAGCRLKGVDWFAWVTGGGDSSLVSSSEIGVAEIVVTQGRALAVTTHAERERMAIEELPREFEIVSLPWAQERAFDEFARSVIGPGPIVSDRPEAQGEVHMDQDWLALKLQLSSKELARYRELGLDAARAVGRALRECESDWRERDVAGLASHRLVECGIDPVLLLVGGEGRLPRHRHPRPTDARIGGRVALVICGRRSGLHVSLARHVFFRRPTSQETANFRAAALVEAEAFGATEDQRPLPDIYRRLKAKYTELGVPHEIERFPQGGATGYLPRESLARPMGALGVRTTEGTAYAWSVAIEEERLEDTIFIGPDKRLIVLTEDPDWPSFEFEGRRRPIPLVRARD